MLQYLALILGRKRSDTWISDSDIPKTSSHMPCTYCNRDHNVTMTVTTVTVTVLFEQLQLV